MRVKTLEVKLLRERETERARQRERQRERDKEREREREMSNKPLVYLQGEPVRVVLGLSLSLGAQCSMVSL